MDITYIFNMTGFMTFTNRNTANYTSIISRNEKLITCCYSCVINKG